MNRKQFFKFRCTINHDTNSVVNTIKIVLLSIALTSSTVYGVVAETLKNSTEFWNLPVDQIYYFLEHEQSEKKIEFVFPQFDSSKYDELVSEVGTHFDRLYTGNTVTPSEILSKQIQFTPLSEERRNFSFVNRPIWYRFEVELEQNTASTWVLTVDGLLEDVTFFELFEGKLHSSLRTGLSYPFNSRAKYDIRNAFSIDIKFAAEQPRKIFYVRAYTGFNPHVLKFSFSSLEYHQKQAVIYTAFQFLYYGSLCASQV